METKIKRFCQKCEAEIDQTKDYYTLRDDFGKVVSICPECSGNPTTSAVDTPHTLTSVAILPNPEGVTDLLPGEVNELHTRQLVRETHRNFLAIGKLLTENRDNAMWSTTGHGSFSEYVESLGMSKSAGYSMIASYEVLSVGNLTEDEILEIGIAKMGLLISAGKVEDTDMVELAKSAPVRDLKEYLGHKVLTNDPNHSIICPHCGVAVEGCQWVRLKT